MDKNKLTQLILSKVAEKHGQTFPREGQLQCSIDIAINAHNKRTDVILEMLKDAYIAGSKQGFNDGANFFLKPKTTAEQDFKDYVNNLT